MVPTFESRPANRFVAIQYVFGSIFIELILGKINFIRIDSIRISFKIN